MKAALEFAGILLIAISWVAMFMIMAIGASPHAHLLDGKSCREAHGKVGSK